MNNLLKHQKGDIERNKKKNKENKSKYSNILKKRTLLNRAKKNIIALLALKKCRVLTNELALKFLGGIYIMNIKPLARQSCY